MAELDGKNLEKYKAMAVDALERIETASDRAGVQANAEAYRISVVKRHVRPDPVALEALFKLHRELGASIRFLVEIGHELDKMEMVDEIDDLDDLKIGEGSSESAL